MASSGMLRRVALVRTDVYEEPSAAFIRVTRIGEVATTLTVYINRHTHCMHMLKEGTLKISDFVSCLSTLDL
jgi:hypothetical protein